MEADVDMAVVAEGWRIEFAQSRQHRDMSYFWCVRYEVLVGTWAGGTKCGVGHCASR